MDGEYPLCSLCGQRADGFGSFPMARGRLCGACAEKLSEWFRCRADVTEAELRAHLAYREENREAVREFQVTKVLWHTPRVCLDTVHGWFTVSTQSGPEANPDLFSFDRLLSCELETEEHKKELFRPGRERYRPRRYEYRFNLWVRLLLDHPQIHEVRFRLNDRPITVSDRNVHAAVTGKVVKDPGFQRCKKAGETIRDALVHEMKLARQGAGAAGSEPAEAEPDVVHLEPHPPAPSP